MMRLFYVIPCNLVACWCESERWATRPYKVN